MGYIMIDGKDIPAYPHNILNRKFECTMINRKDDPAYPHNISNRKFECTIINRKYLLKGGAFSHE